MGFVAIDIETNSLEIEKAKLVGISMCYNEAKAFYIPIMHKESVTQKLIQNQITLDDVITIAESSKSKVMSKIVDQKETIQRNLILMSLLSVMISDNNKMKILNKINSPQLSLHKYGLTKLLI